MPRSRASGEKGAARRRRLITGGSRRCARRGLTIAPIFRGGFLIAEKRPRRNGPRAVTQRAATPGGVLEIMNTRGERTSAALMRRAKKAGSNLRGSARLNPLFREFARGRLAGIWEKRADAALARMVRLAVC